jgi:biotin synthase
MFKDFQAMGFMAGANGMLIGGYLTVKGRAVAEDQQLIKEINELWTNSPMSLPAGRQGKAQGHVKE